MAVDMHALLTDLGAETGVINDMVGDIAPADWDRPTPADGWSIRDQVSHLAFFDAAAALAATDADEFHKQTAELRAKGGDTFTEEIANRYRSMPGTELLQWFQKERRNLIETFTDIDPKARLPWYGPDMSAASSVTARMMETWAHGQDIADALGVTREPTLRLRNIAHLGVSTYGFAYGLRGLDVPEVPVRVELSAADGSTWTWGPEDAADRVTGTALDFCLVVTQRRNIADTQLHTEGATAAEWMSIAQAFAGVPGPGRKPGQFPVN
ncbi:uncharacterized protein (TIGR03084 family) [Antricoccus suffuscus]|uniref:Uncharacterized protein (TIGR03084 family) n=1 Tax=Antricoccus suffuscus TaxID=1629062 RepID=A0A2T1A0D3_9ACTN|nr:TIGR03084 family metal-binding protein [Antricoccus suffuscus]PRZ42060.1 uncharacterized protein (TIGR03084 family) [Antricoccus suffuscus]